MTWYKNLAIFLAISRAKTVDVLTILKKSHFRRLSQAKTAIFCHYFLVGRVVSGHVGVALKSNNALRISTFVVIETVI